jgi:hypothetical protein
MPTRRYSRRSPTKAPRTTRRVGSWMALLAATTLGVEGVGTVRAEVKADGGLVESGEYRLVVQSYDAREGEVPGLRNRPVGSYQRAVTAAELRRGVQVNLLEFRRSAPESEKGSVVAWIETGKPDLEFDGRTARPLPGSMFGQVRRALGDSSVQIRLSRKAA